MFIPKTQLEKQQQQPFHSQGEKLEMVIKHWIHCLLCKKPWLTSGHQERNDASYDPFKNMPCNYIISDKDFPKPEILEAYLADRQLLIAVTWCVKASLTTFEEAVSHKTHKQPSQTNHSEKHFSRHSPWEMRENTFKDHIKPVTETAQMIFPCRV